MTDQIERIRARQIERIRARDTGLAGAYAEYVQTDRRILLAEVDRLNAEIDEWRARWKEQAKIIEHLERVVAGMA